MKIGLLLISTGRYHDFVQNIITSADNFLFKEEEVIYYLFTDDIKKEYKTDREIIRTQVNNLPWPFPTLYRFKFFNKNKKFNVDYLFYCDVDMMFIQSVDPNILSKIVGTQHPGYVGQKGCPDQNPESLSFIYSGDNERYYCGGFWGGETDSMLKMFTQLENNIDIDLSNGVISTWHDESHLNRYFLDNPPTKVLSPSYCYPEGETLDYVPILIALNKRHQHYRWSNDVEDTCGVIVYHKNASSNYHKDWIDNFKNSILKQTYSNYVIYELNYGTDGFRIFNESKFYQIELSNHVEAMNCLLQVCLNDGVSSVFNTNVDDSYDINRFQLQIDEINKGFDVVSSNFCYVTDFYGEDMITKTFLFDKMDIKSELDRDHNIIAHPCVCYSKRFIERFRYNTHGIPREDLDLWKESINKGFKFKILEPTLLYYRIHDNQVTKLNEK